MDLENYPLGVKDNEAQAFTRDCTARPVPAMDGNGHSCPTCPQSF
jgi:hypothetical protein